MMRQCLVVIVLTAISDPAFAQVERFDVGQRMVEFERVWDLRPDPRLRAKSVPDLKKAIAGFFGGNFREAGAALDAARRALNPKADDANRWADAVVARPGFRLIDVEKRTLNVRWQALYDPIVPRPANARLQLLLDRGVVSPPAWIAVGEQLPLDQPLDLAQLPLGDNVVYAQVAVGDKILASYPKTISVVPNLETRLSTLKTAVENLRTDDATIESFTLRSHAQLLLALSRGYVAETNFPANRLLDEAEGITHLGPHQFYFDRRRAGQFWLRVPVNNSSAAVRLFVPKSAAQGKTIPLVVALHGMGGTENLFFDGYGHGEIVRQCEQRGWLLVAPRFEGFFGAPPVVPIIDELAKRYPVDRRNVFVVGHSLGAGQALGLARNYSDRWAGVACLGGGGPLGHLDRAKELPIFVGVGTEDFALGGARALAKSLKDGGHAKSKSIEYPDIEHITIVQVALPEVFKWFDELAK